VYLCRVRVKGMFVCIYVYVYVHVHMSDCVAHLVTEHESSMQQFLVSLLLPRTAEPAPHRPSYT
jgi:hypothetical protein